MGTGGAGGAVDHVTITQVHSLVSGSSASEFKITSGKGGDSTNGAAGVGAAISVLTISDKVGGNFYQIKPGNGGKGATSGGDAGKVDTVTVAAPLADVRIGGTGIGTGGAATTAGMTGGHGANIANVKGTAGYLFVNAGAGGAGPANGGHGGNGGDVNDINVAVTVMAQQIASGSGGKGGTSNNATGGNGGKITNVHITGVGDIGNFAKNFGTGLDEMGGLFVGLGGVATGAGAVPGITGSVDHVTARRIASILAADSSTTASSLTTANAAHDVSNITAAIIDADVNGNHLFDFTEGGAAVGFQPPGTPDGDTALDGLVLALSAGFDTATVHTFAVGFAPILV